MILEFRVNQNPVQTFPVSIHATIEWQHGVQGPFTYYWENSILPSKYAFGIVQVEFHKVVGMEKHLTINYFNPKDPIYTSEVMNEYWEVTYLERRYVLTNCGDWVDAFVTMHRKLVPQWVHIQSNVSQLGDIEYDWPDPAPGSEEQQPQPPYQDQESYLLPEDYYRPKDTEAHYSESSARVWRWYTMDDRYPKFLPSTGLAFDPYEWITTHWMNGWIQAHQASIDAGIIIMLDGGLPVFEPPIKVSLMEFVPFGQPGPSPGLDASPYDFENRGEASIQFGTLRWKQLVLK
jgi:hypothetical protein